MRKKIVFILGMHRSGTSLTAEIVNAMGFSIPGTSLDPIDSVNAHGFWESKEVVDINERILSAAGLKWYHICPVGHVFKNIANTEEFSAEISEFLRGESERVDNIVIKDPRLCLLWPLWFSAIDQSVFDVRVIFVNRHPSSVASSIKTRDGFSFFSSHLLWLYYFFSVFGSKNFPDVLVLNYERLLVDEMPGELISRFLDVDRISKKSLGGIVDPLLQRNSGTSFPVDNLIFELEDRVYRSLSHGDVYRDFSFLDNEKTVFENFIFSSSDLIFALNESNNCIVESRTDLVFIGSMHSRALEVIKEKDFAIFESGAYIDNCHARIAELDLSVLGFDEVSRRLINAESEILLRDEHINKMSEYISECEGRIFDLEFSMSEFLALRERLTQVECVLRQKEADAEHNVRYIDKCHARIAELDALVAREKDNCSHASDITSDQCEKKSFDKGAPND